MASKSLGTLTIDLVAKVGGFVSGMDKAERASQKWSQQVQKDAAASTVAILSIGTALKATAVSVGAAGFALLKSTAEQVSATDQWAKSLKISTQELLAWQFAAERAGVQGDQMADIFKDLGDKIGDAILNKSGEAVDALDSLGLSAEKLSKVSPDQQMLAIGEALGKISTNAGKVTILESLGNDLSKLLPLFDNNNEKLKQFIQLAKDYGVAPDPQSIDDLVKVNNLFLDMEAQVKGLKMEIASGLAKVDLSPLQGSLDKVHKVLTDPAVLKGLVDLVSEVAQLAGWLVKAAAAAGELAAKSSNRMAAIGGNIDVNNIDQVAERIEYLQQMISKRSGFYDQGESFAGWLFGKDDSTGKMKAELDSLIAQKNKLLKADTNGGVLPTAVATVTGPDAFGLPPGQTNGKTTPDAGPKKLENAFKATEQSYLRQIALIDTTGKKTAEVTEAQKLQFDIADGKLAGISDRQKTRLEQLATEIDRLNTLKKENIENAKAAAFAAELQNQNDNAKASLDVDIQGAGLGDKERDRMKERLSIQREFLDKQNDLNIRYQSGDIEKSLYDKNTAALKSAMSDRMKIQDDYYQSLDAMQSDWFSGAKDGLADWLDSSSNYSSSAANIVSSSLDSALDTVSSALAGNKVSWKDWGVSVLNMIAKVALQMAAVNAVSGIFGSFAGSLGGAAAGASSSSNAFSSGAYSNLTLNAKGGVYDSPDLSKFSSSIVSSPTMFAFAKGAGLMGEAGPEAIMPLTRAADGSLGVRALSTDSGGGGATISVNAPVSIDGGGSAGVSNANTASTAKQLQSIIQQTLTDRLRKEISPGGILYRP